MNEPFTFEKEQDGPAATSHQNGGSQECFGAGGASNEDCFENEPIRGLSDLYFPQEDDGAPVKDIADVLVDMGKLTAGDRASLRQEQSAKPGSDVATLLLKSGRVSKADISQARARLYGMEFRDIQPDEVEKQAFRMLDIDFIKNTSVCPIAIQSDTLVVATSEPANLFAIEEVKRKTQMNVQVVACTSEAIEAVCNSFDEAGIEYNLDDIISDMMDVEVIQDQAGERAEDLEKMAGESPVIKFVNYLVSNAIHEGASDIHIEPKQEFTRVRYRIDGTLFVTMKAPLKMHSAVVSRVKIMSNLDISERRLPQDGKISVIVGGRAIDLRISTLPTNRGEKVVIRILDSKAMMLDLEQLGMDPTEMVSFKQQITLPHGILLVTGPTGAGKSTTLYSALCQMDGGKLNISTVEDPVEYELDFCNQVQVNDKIGLNFATALRSLLRQDPDIMMIGEIRDNETARIAVQAALTGHLVLSTLHTNDAASSVTRLVDIGIDAYLIAASLNAVLAQRLVRKICQKCKQIYQVPDNIRKYIKKAGVDPGQLFHGAGCESCRNSGYLGRTGIYELLIVDEAFRDMINKDASVDNMRRAFRESGQPSLFDDGIKKVKAGLTTIEEVLRVTEVYGHNEEEAFVENIG
ncbi:MAG: Flp pilus assembly complex ATPase component TadA [Planctomycetota bacterium]|nr:MAG: Flp pilus assembly complex ATPase component TadA [Planctomycetota bacterium]